jgi:hypothetical protein
MLQDGIRVVALVCERCLGFALAQQQDGLRAVVHLVSGDTVVQRFVLFVGEPENLGCQTSAGTPQSLPPRPTPILSAPLFAARARMLASPHDG